MRLAPPLLEMEWERQRGPWVRWVISDDPEAAKFREEHPEVAKRAEREARRRGIIHDEPDEQRPDEDRWDALKRWNVMGRVARGDRELTRRGRHRWGPR
jgi:hypothetical protein